jgi:hypothetical protein
MNEEEEEEEEDERDDTKDYLSYLMEKAKEEGKVDELPLMPEGVDEEEAMRLAMKASLDQPPPTAPSRYLSVVMPPDLLEGVAVRLAMEDSNVATSPWSLWLVLPPTYHTQPPTTYPLPS